MKHVVYYDDYGRIHLKESLDENTTVRNRAGLNYLVLDDKAPPNQYVDIETKTLRQIPQRPTRSHVWNAQRRRWELDTSIAARHARQTRNAQLQACDWTQLPDVPLETRAAWAEYRRALRDITEQPGFPDNIEWPEPPE